MQDEALKPIADVIEEAILDARSKQGCLNPPGCGREDCSVHKTRHTANVGYCRAVAEFVAVKVNDHFARIHDRRVNELLASGNALLERARAAERDRDLAKQLAESFEPLRDAIAAVGKAILERADG